MNVHMKDKTYTVGFYINCGICIFIFLYIFAPGFSFAKPSSYDIPSAEWMISSAKQLNMEHYTLSRHQVTDVVTGLISDRATDEIATWLDGKGKIGIDLSSDRRSIFHNSGIHVLMQLYSHMDMLTFLQTGTHYTDNRHHINSGLGFRYFQSAWMMGANIFYDYDYTMAHSRMGAGIEYARDFIRLSANSYIRISDWRNDKQFDDYQSRPANGWDVRMEAWLPEYPHLGGRLSTEYYYGEHVALFNHNERNKNPYAITTNVNYTPFPLITAGINYIKGRAGISEVQGELNLSYIIGERWEKQISPKSVAGQRLLTGSRHEFVNRNNTIILDYRREETLMLNFPPTLEGMELTEISFTPEINSRYSINRLELDDSQLIRAGGKVISVSPTYVVIQLPVSNSGPIRLSGVAIDSQGNRSNLAMTEIYITQDERTLSLTTDKDEALADGRDSIMFTLHVDNSAGEASSGAVIHLKTDAGILSSQEGRTDDKGNYTVLLTSQVSGEIHVTATVGSQTVTHPGVMFRENTSITVDVSKTQITSSGFDRVTYTATVFNTDGSPVVGETVIWKTSLGLLSAESSQTDRNGKAQVTLTSTEQGIVRVSASANKNIRPAPVVKVVEYLVTFMQYSSNGMADGKTPVTLIVTVLDSDMNPFPNVDVHWTTTSGKLSDTSTTTDSAGVTFVTITSYEVGLVTITADIKGNDQTAKITFYEAPVSVTGQPPQ